MNSDPDTGHAVAKLCETALGGDRSTIRPDKLKSDLTARLSRIEGQVRGVRNMIGKDIYCDDILNQIAAVQAAMKAVSRLLLRSHIQGCVVDKINRGDREIIDELLVTISKLT